MKGSIKVSGIAAWVAFGLVVAAGTSAERSAGAGRRLTIDRIFHQPRLEGELAKKVRWRADGLELAYLIASGSGKNARTELWGMDVRTGSRRLLITPRKLQTISGLEDYRWSPDGNALLLTSKNSLSWIALKTQAARTLVAGPEAISNAQISPDGKWVSFLRDHNLWLVSTEGGQARAITRDGSEEKREGELDPVLAREFSMQSGYWWSPDSSSIAFLETNEGPVEKYPILQPGAEKTGVEWQRYPLPGGAIPVVHVCVSQVNGTQIRRMDTGQNHDVYLPRVTWLPNSTELAVQRLNRRQTVLDLLIARAGTGHSRSVLRETDPYWINVSDGLRFLDGGRRFLWSSERSGYRHLYLYGIDGADIRQLTHGPWEVTRVAFVDERRGTVYFMANERTPVERHLYRVGLNGSGFARLTQENGWHDADFAPNGNAYVDTASSAMSPPRQELTRIDGTAVASLHPGGAGLIGYAASPVEFFTVKMHDNVWLDAMTIKPTGFNPSRKYPALVYVAGGPRGQAVRNAWGGPAFLWHELMAERGFLIFAIDTRGSGGHSHLFEEPIHFRLGAQELSDLREAIASFRKLPYVDGERIGIWGTGYGAQIALHALLEDPEDFKAGFADSPITNWRLYDSIFTERYLGLPQDHSEGYVESSPLETAGQLKGKLLLAAATEDKNIHFAHTLELQNKLLNSGKYAKIVLLPGQPDTKSDPAVRSVVLRRAEAFFLENLR